MRRLTVIGAAIAAAAILTFAAPTAAADGECSCKRPLATPQDTPAPKVPNALLAPRDGNTHLPRPLATDDIDPCCKRPL